MNATLKQLDPTRVELEIPIPPQDLEVARNRAFHELSKRAKIPGFRPGKVPRGIFEQHYGTGMIEQRAIEEIVPQVYEKAIEELDLYPLANPDVELLPSEREGEPLRVKATVTVRPEIALGEYKGLEVTQERNTATDEEVDASLESLRREAAILVPVERPVQLGDVATLDYEGKIEGEPFEGGKAEKQPTEIDADRFIPGFIDSIVGMRAGETKEFETTFPEEFPKAELAGKKATFTVTVQEIKERELPQVDDAFAERVTGKPTTVLELKIDLRRRLDAVAAAKARRAMSAQLVEKLLDSHDFALPAVLVDHEISALLDDYKNWALTAGPGSDDPSVMTDPEERDRRWAEVLKEMGKTEDELRESFRADAQRRVKTSLLLGAIARAEGIEATREDIDHELEHVAAQYRQPKERMLQLLASNMGSVVAGIVRNKTMDRILNQAKLVPATPDSQP